MNRTLSELSEYLSETRSALFRSVADVSPEMASFRPEPEAWSVAEIMDHLCRVERGTNILLKRFVEQARTAGLNQEDATASVLSSLDSFQVVEAPVRAKAPDRVRPAPHVPVAESVERLEQSRHELLRVLDEAEGLALSQVSFDHVFLGKLNGYQWILVLGQHEARHTRQIQRTKGQWSA
ncbi:MAG: DinB family protein [Acidobacteriia bacterium]|nr:DinB family protein [Terriglobia bacterium]